MTSKTTTNTRTLLFTDIQNSTILVQDDEAGYLHLLNLSRDILRKQFNRVGGTEVDVVGDGSFFIFDDANSAVLAAITVQQEFITGNWNVANKIKLRIGIHTGAPSKVGNGFIGIDVHKCSRIANAAHGNQILTSATTVGLIDNAETEIVNLGMYWLAGLKDPEQLHQISIPDHGQEFPQPRCRGRVGVRIPQPTTSIVGRSETIELITHQLCDTDTKLLTITGPGGVGKTTVAFAIASAIEKKFPDGVFLLDLTSINSIPKFLDTIAEQLGADPDAAAKSGIIERIRNYNFLLILDNCDDIVAAGPELQEILTSAPGTKFLATSRIPFKVKSEQEIKLPPINTPTQGESIPDNPAVQLFLNQIKRVSPYSQPSDADLVLIGDICKKLDGLPLALELAASRTNLLTLQELSASMDKSLDLLATDIHGAPNRHKVLRSCIDQSYESLTEQEQSNFRRLAVFEGRFTVNQAAALLEINPSDLATVSKCISPLVEKNMVVRTDTEKGAKLSLLQTMREYATEKQRHQNESVDIGFRHLVLFSDSARKSERILSSSDQAEEMERLEQDLPNIRKAIEFSLRHDHATGLGLSLVTSLMMFWWHRYIEEGMKWYLSLLEKPSAIDAPNRPHALSRAAYLAYYVGDMPLCERLLDETQLDESNSRNRITEAVNLGLRAKFYASRDRYDEAIEAANSSLENYREVTTGWSYAIGLGVLGETELAADHREEAFTAFQECIDILSDLNENWVIAGPIARLGDLALRDGDYPLAQRKFQQSLSIWRAAGGGSGTPQAVAGLGRLELTLGHYVEAFACYSESLELASQVRSRSEYPWALAGLASLLTIQEDHKNSTLLFGTAVGLARNSGIPLTSYLDNEYATFLLANEENLPREEHARIWNRGLKMSRNSAYDIGKSACSDLEVRFGK